MKTSEILALLPGLEALDGYQTVSATGHTVETPYLFPSKVRFNIARNLRTASKVKHDFETDRRAIFQKHATDGKLEDGSEAKAAASAELQALLDVENAVTILQLPKEELVQDEIPVPASVIAILMPIISEPAEPETP